VAAASRGDDLRLPRAITTTWLLTSHAAIREQALLRQERRPRATLPRRAFRIVCGLPSLHLTSRRLPFCVACVRVLYAILTNRP
jgi:hypothetical protein